MIESPFLQSLIAEKQSPSNQDYFATRASQCFSAATGPSWLDVSMDASISESTPGDKAVPNDERAETNLFSSDARSLSASTLKIETEFELRRLLNSCDATLKIFFIRQRNSASRLSINWRLFDTLCQQCGIYERVRDYVMCFGLRNGESEVTPPAMHFHISRDEHSYQVTRLECAYVLRFVETNDRQHGNPWSVRQSGVYHKFTSVNSSSTWLFIALSSSAESQLQSWRAIDVGQPNTDPFEVHYMMFDAAVSGWRRYIIYLADEVRKQSDRAILAGLETDGEAVTRLEERQYLKQIEDSVTDLISSLSFMLENIDVVIRCYQDFRAQNPLTTDSNRRCSIRADTVLKGLEDRKRDLLRFDAQAQALRRKVDSASSLVSNILDLNNGNTLKVLALESRTENANMSLLTKKSVQDAAMVKVLTIVTLVYLPITVVTNFFSTQFINLVTNASGAVHLSVVPEVWILFAASIPLTTFTIYIWWIFAQREVQGKLPGGWDFVVRKTKAVLGSGRRPADTATVNS